MTWCFDAPPTPQSFPGGFVPLNSPFILSMLQSASTFLPGGRAQQQEPNAHALNANSEQYILNNS